MLRISLQTLRARRGTLAGAFVAIWLAVTLASATGLLMAGGARSTGRGTPRRDRRGRPRRPDRHHRPRRGRRGHRRHPRSATPAATVERVADVPGVARAVGDIAFPAGAWNEQGSPCSAERADRLIGHGWDSAALTPYQLTSGRAPSGPRDVVADARLGTRVGADAADRQPDRRRALPRDRPRRRPRRSAIESQAAVFFTARRSPPRCPALPDESTRSV